MMKKIKHLNTEVPASLRNIDLKAVLRRNGMFTKQRVTNELKEAAKPIAREMLKKRQKNNHKAIEPVSSKYNPQFTDEQIQDYAAKQIHIAETVEVHFENRLKQYIKKIENGFLAHLDQEVGQRKTEKGQLKMLKGIEVKDYFGDNEDELLVAAQFDFAPLLENIATIAGKQALDLINSNEVYLPFDYRKVIKDNVDKFAHSLIDTDKEVLTNYLSEGIDNGESVAEIRKRITDNFGEYNKMQAQRITRTEVMRASNQASLDAWQQSGVVEGKQWVIAGATDECAAYDGEIKSLDGSFYSNDSEFADGDPPLHPNCKCVLIPVVVKD